VRQVALDLSDLEMMVQEATNSEAWGPHGQLLSKLADASVEGGEAHAQIVGVLGRRIDHARAHPEKWRNAYKSLLVIEHLTKHGSPRFVDEMRSRRYLSVLETLSKHFEFVDPKDLKDHGIAVRNRAKSLVLLLRSSDRIKEERGVARKNAGKYSSYSSRDAAREDTWSPRKSERASHWDAGGEGGRGRGGPPADLPLVKPMSSLGPSAGEIPAATALPDPVRIGSPAVSRGATRTNWKQRIDPKIANTILTPQTDASGLSSIATGTTTNTGAAASEASSMTPALAATLLENTYNLEGLGLSAPQMQGTTSSGQQNAAADPLAMLSGDTTAPPDSPALLDFGAGPAGPSAFSTPATQQWSSFGSEKPTAAPGNDPFAAAPTPGDANWAAFGAEREALHGGSGGAGALAEDLFVASAVPDATAAMGAGAAARGTPERGSLSKAAALGKDPFADLGLL
jgi:epsin